MADMMIFPETVEEFMERYKITDTEQIYTNGAELVPIFRMKQWFEHKPERKKGKWIYEEDGIIHGHCSCCGFLAIYQETDVFGYDFCPNCGADMRGDSNE